MYDNNTVESFKTPLQVPEFLKNLGHFFGLRTEEEPASYTVIEKDGDREVRDYTGFSTVNVRVDGNYESAMEAAFRQLADYIFGFNARQAVIEMTAPVLQQRTPTGWMMSFILPSKYSAENAPDPLNSRISLTSRPHEMVACIQYSGWTNKKTIYAKTRELFQWIEEQNKYKIISKPRSAQYDPPFALPFMRRNEVQVTVKMKSLH